MGDPGTPEAFQRQAVNTARCSSDKYWLSGYFATQGVGAQFDPSFSRLNSYVFT
jgi:hypothetical protein